MQITAVTLDRVGGPVRVERLDLDPPRAGEVLVRLHASGVCHSDLHAIEGRHPADLPCVVGHEGAGEIVELGRGVEDLQVGDHVVLNWLPSCGHCFYCTRGQHHVCTVVTDEVWTGAMADGTTRIRRAGESILHYAGVSTWASHMVVDHRCCQVIDKRVPFDVAAIIGCAVSTGVGAVRAAHVGRDTDVVIVGAGGVGLSTVLGAAMAGAHRIIVIEPNPEKHQLARDLGATDVLHADEHAVDHVRALTDGRGADVVIEAVGRPALQEQWIEGVRPGGTLVLVGLPGTTERSSFAAADLSRRGKTIIGSYYGAGDAGELIAELCDAQASGRLGAERLISQRLPLDAVQQALDAMAAGAVARVVLSTDGEATP